MSALPVSVVGPVFNERQNLARLCAELTAALESAPGVGAEGFEIVLVDDCSDDGSLEELLRLAKEEPRLRVLAGSRRQGQSAALAAGIRAARGAVIVTTDSDLQNDPADIPALLARLDGCDLAHGVRQRRRDSAVKRLSSGIANGVRRAVLKDGLTDVGCALRAGRAELLKDLPPFNGLHRFLGPLAKSRGARVVEVPVRHRPRQAGKSKYGVMDRLWRGLWDLAGVRWLQRRTVDLTVVQEVEEWT